MLLLMGIAGSGKGTQGKLLAEARGYHIISTGELLRNFGSDEQHARMQQGVYLGDEEVTELLNTALNQLEDQNKVILDGYPRTRSQAEWLMSHADRFKVDYVLHLIASRDAVKARMQSRGRKDDNDAAIEARIAEYEKNTLPLLEYFDQSGVPVVEVNGEGEIEAIHERILSTDKEKTEVVPGQGA